MALPHAPLCCVLFDLDGTLVETHIDFPAMTRAMLALTADARVPHETVAGKDILGIVQAASAFLSAAGGDGDAFRRTAHAQLEEMEVVGCARPRLLPHADALLAGLADRGLRVGIVTRNCRRVAEDLVGRFALPHDALLTRDDVRLAKPHPEHLWDALAALGGAPERAAMVGDHWMDVQAGRAAGCAVTVGLRGAHDDSWFAPCPPTYLVSDLAEVAGLL